MSQQLQNEMLYGEITVNNYDDEDTQERVRKLNATRRRLRDYASYSDFLHIRTAELLDDLEGEIDWSDNRSIAGHIILGLNADIRVQRDITMGGKWRYVDSLKAGQIAQILMRKHHFANVCGLGVSNDGHSIFMRYDTESGIYTDDMTLIDNDITELSSFSATEQTFKAAKKMVQSLAPIKTRYEGDTLIAVGNGIYNTDTGELEPFTCDKVFMTKCPIAYDKGAQDVSIRTPNGTEWSLENWLKSLSDDIQIQQLLKELMAACIRPRVWDKAVWLCNREGANGKSSFIKLLQGIVGPANYAALSINDFNGDYDCGGLLRKLCVISEETDSDAYIDKVAKYKAAVTGSIIHAEIKYKDPIDFTFRGLVIQAINGYPRTQDKTDSFYRRLLLVPFDKSFSGDDAIPEIREDYLNRPEVLSYALKISLETQIAELSMPDKCRELLDDYAETNNPVREFWNAFFVSPDEIPERGEKEQNRTDAFVWKCLPFTFLYALYKAYLRKTSSKKPLSLKEFRIEIAALAIKDGKWLVKDGDDKFNVGRRMDGHEPLILTWCLKDWQKKYPTNPGDPEELTSFDRKSNYRGLQYIGG